MKQGLFVHIDDAADVFSQFQSVTSEQKDKLREALSQSASLYVTQSDTLIRRKDSP